VVVDAEHGGRALPDGFAKYLARMRQAAGKSDMTT
jgi:hypothetical protein